MGYDEILTGDVIISEYLTSPVVLTETQEIENNLIGLWRLNKGSGVTAFDTSGNGNNGTLEGTTPTWVDGKSGKAVNLPGVNERIDCGNGAPLDQLGNGSFWISFQMKSKDTVPLSNSRIWTKDQNDLQNTIYLMSNLTNNRLVLYIEKNNIVYIFAAFSTGTAPFDTIWNHIVLEINRITDKAIVYMNTVKDATEIDLSAMPADISNTGNVAWGANVVGGGPYEGALDELRIYTGEPTQAEIDALYNYPEGLTGGQIAKDVILTEAVTGKGVI